MRYVRGALLLAAFIITGAEWLAHQPTDGRGAGRTASSSPYAGVGRTPSWSEGRGDAPTASAPDGDASPSDASASTGSGDPASCPALLLGGSAPSLPAKQMAGGVTLCSDDYVSFSSPATRTPLWSAERLTPGNLRTASDTERASEFEPDQRLDPNMRAELADYRHSGYDRGHLSPSGDMPGPGPQAQSFRLSNVAPQNAGLNRGPWAGLEGDVRSLARRRDAVYVVTGVLFQGTSIQTTPTGRVLVPTSFWKGVYSPGEGAVVVVAPNGPGGFVNESVDDFRRDTGIDPFPSIPAGDRARVLELAR